MAYLGTSVSTAKAVDVINAIPNARPETRLIICVHPVCSRGFCRGSPLGVICNLF